MKLKYQQIKGRRVKNHKFLGIKCNFKSHEDIIWAVKFKDNTWIISLWSNLITDEEGRWLGVKNISKEVDHYSSDFPCRSVRAFRRRLKQWKKILPKNTECILVSRYIKCDVYGKL